MEDRLLDGLQIPFGDFLGDSVGNRWYPQRPCFRRAVALWNLDPSNRWRKVAPRGHSVPELVEVGRKISLEVRNRLSIHSSCSLVGLHLLEGFPDFPLWNVEGIGSRSVQNCTLKGLNENKRRTFLAGQYEVNPRSHSDVGPRCARQSAG